MSQVMKQTREACISLLNGSESCLPCAASWLAFVFVHAVCREKGVYNVSYIRSLSFTRQFFICRERRMILTTIITISIAAIAFITHSTCMLSRNRKQISPLAPPQGIVRLRIRKDINSHDIYCTALFVRVNIVLTARLCAITSRWVGYTAVVQIGDEEFTITKRAIIKKMSLMLLMIDGTVSAEMVMSITPSNEVAIPARGILTFYAAIGPVRGRVAKLVSHREYLEQQTFAVKDATPGAVYYSYDNGARPVIHGMCVSLSAGLYDFINLHIHGAKIDEMIAALPAAPETTANRQAILPAAIFND